MQRDRSSATTLSRLARRLLIAISVVFAAGLSGVVLARAEVHRLRLIWITSGVSLVPVTSESRLPQLASSPVAADLVVVDPPDQSRRIMQMEVTAYCPCTKCCGPHAQGITASGKLVSYNAGRFVAADTRLLPFGTKVQIPGYGEDQPVEVIDRGGAIKGNKLDVFFPTHQQALEWGRQMLQVIVETG